MPDRDLPVGKRQEFIVLTYDQFDHMASLHLGEPYSFAATQEANNYSCYTIHVEDSDIPFLQEWVGKVTAKSSPRDVLISMVAAKMFPPGDYLIEVAW